MLMVLPLLFLGLSAISPLNTLQINPSQNSSKDVNSYSSSVPYTYKYLCCHPLLTKKNGNCIIVYVSAFLLTFTNNCPTLIAYKIQSDYTSNTAECFEIAGGIGVHGASHPTWSSQTTLKWPAVSNQAPSSSNPPSSWCFNSGSISKYDSPNNQMSWGSTSQTSTTVTTGIGASAGCGGVGVSAQYSNSVQTTYTSYEFCMSPVTQQWACLQWQYSDNQGMMGQYPSSATIYQYTGITTNNYAWQHIFIDEQAQFTLDCCSQDICSVTAAGGLNYHVS